MKRQSRASARLRTKQANIHVEVGREELRAEVIQVTIETAARADEIVFRLEHASVHLRAVT